jgi:hypothetical protein
MERHVTSGDVHFPNVVDIDGRPRLKPEWTDRHLPRVCSFRKDESIPIGPNFRASEICANRFAMQCSIDGRIGSLPPLAKYDLAVSSCLLAEERLSQLLALFAKPPGQYLIVMSLLPRK